MPTIYAGPGKLVFNSSCLLWPEGTNGKITYKVTQEKQDIASGMHGRVGSTLGNTEGKIDLTPFDNWTALQYLFPPYLGVTSAAGSGALAIGTRIHNPPFGAGSDMASVIWNPNGSGLTIARTAVTKPPDLHLGAGKALYGQVELTALPKTSAGVPVAVGTATAFHSITESAMGEPAGSFILTDFIREKWTGAIASGPTGLASGLEAEIEWTLSSNIAFNSPKKQGQVLIMTLASVEFMAKCRPYGPTWSNIDAAVLGTRVTGKRFGHPGNQPTQLDLVLTSDSGKTVTLYNVDFHEEGFEFGGTELTTGEIGFVTQLVPGTSVALLAFSS